MIWPNHTGAEPVPKMSPLHALLDAVDAETPRQSQGSITRTTTIAAGLSTHNSDVHGRGHLGAVELGQTRAMFRDIPSNRKPVAEAFQGATIHAK
ncbi:hypothetical protein PGQ11_001845 [Apiospora arundinis]|uniref:Uncharacterized protein n=1 Tax=Apiospora arundinis TaxID=335852 RepID=A0ABR2JGP7_9PEZI